MRPLAFLTVCLLSAGGLLSGCAAANVVGTAVDVTGSAVGAAGDVAEGAVDVTTSAAGAVGDAVTGDDDE